MKDRFAWTGFPGSNWNKTFLLSALALFAILGGSAAARADYTTTINPGTQWGVWDGWGCSLCWWANVFGTRDDLADIVFTTKTTALNGVSLPGLGMNIARYNAGGSSPNMTIPSSLPAFKQIQGYWLDWNSSDPSSSSWNWYLDSNQRNMMWKARDRGANWIELFSNSPIWWMCYNHSTAGAAGSGQDNLQSWNYDQAAVYLATVAKYAHDNWGVNFNSVEPFNEPIAGWWNYPCTQEGCNFATGTQQSVINYLRTELNNRGLNSTPVAASDENTTDQATSTWNSFSSQTKSNVGHINVHGYAYGGGRRDLLYNAASSAGKKLWMSEYGENDATGMSLAGNLNLDMRWLHMTGWCYWQPFDSGGWGLIQSNPGDNWIGTPNMKYYVLAQFTRHIRQGMQIIDGGEGNTVAAYDSTAHKLVIVTTNYGTAQWINYDLSKFTTVNGPITRWDTNTGGGNQYIQHNDTSLSGKKFWSWFPTNTIQTFEVQNVWR